jgi:membrane fusion protein (multidrug efflux system)
MKRSTVAEYEAETESKLIVPNDDVQGDSHIEESQLDGELSPIALDEPVEPPAKPSFIKRHRLLLVVLGAIALSGAAILGFRWWQFQRTHVSTENAQIQGHISPIAPNISGTVQKVLVKDGDFVKAGQPLVVLEDQDLNLKVQQAEANLETAKAELKSATDTLPLTQNTNVSQVQQAESNLAAKQAAITAAQTNVNQAESGVSSAQAKVTQAKSGISAAQAQVRQAQSGVAAAQSKVKQAASGISAAQAKVAQAQVEVNKNQADFQRYQYLFNQGAISVQQRDLAQAAFRNAQANLQVVQNGVGQAQAEYNNSQAQVQQAQDQVSNAKAELGQAQAEYSNAIAQVQQAQAQVNNAKSLVQKSQAEAQASKGQVTENSANGQKVVVQQDQMQIAQAQVKQAAAALTLARQQIKYTVINAPLSGTVGKLTAQVGQKVQPAQPLMSVVPLQTEQIYVDANFKETSLKNLRVGEPADIEVDAYPGEVFRATVAGVSPATGAEFALLPPDNATGNFNKVVQWVPVRLVFNPDTDPQHKLRAGLSAKVTVDTGH